jgi:hypothetical protein
LIEETIEDWVMTKCDDWRDNYESNYEARFDEYYRLWRGIWTLLTLSVSQKEAVSLPLLSSKLWSQT